MSWLSEIGHDFAKRPLQNTAWALLGGPVGLIAAKGLSKIPHTTAKEHRDAVGAAAAQINYYTEEKNQLIAAKAEAEQQKTVERTRINEKGIRARRNQNRGQASSYSAPLDTGIKSTLG